MLFPVTEHERLNRSKLTRLRISLDALPVEIPAVALESSGKPLDTDFIDRLPVAPDDPQRSRTAHHPQSLFGRCLPDFSTVLPILPFQEANARRCDASYELVFKTWM